MGIKFKLIKMFRIKFKVRFYKFYKNKINKRRALDKKKRGQINNFLRSL